MGSLSEKQLLAADVDNDGEVAVSDVTMLQEYLDEYDISFI